MSEILQSPIKSEVKPVSIDKGIPRFDENPFMANFQIRTRNKITKFSNLKIMSRDGEKDITNDVLGNSIGVFSRSEKLDMEKFVKVYSNKTGGWFNLSARGNDAFQVLLIVLSNNEPGKTAVFLPYEVATKIYQQLGKKVPSDKTFWRAMEELRNAKIIAKGAHQSWYWTNPAVMFNGDRVAFIECYEIDREKITIEQPTLMDAIEAN